jgi:hypothetical protein
MSAAVAYKLEQDEAVVAVPVDFLTQLFSEIRPKLADTTSLLKARLRLFWSCAKNAQDLGARDVVADEFMRLAIEVGFITASGYWVLADVRDNLRRLGREDIAHILDWAARGLNPFDYGPLR